MPEYAVRPDNFNFVNAFAQGYAAPAAMEKAGLDNALASQRLQAEQAQQNALRQYGQTGDIKALTSASPEMALKLQALEAEKQKAQTAAMLPGLKMAYAYSDGLKNPNTYTQTRAMLVNTNPWMAKNLPEQWTPDTPAFVDQQKTAVGELLKLHSENVPVIDYQGIPTGRTAPKGAIMLKPPGKSLDEIAAESAVKTKAKWENTPDIEEFDDQGNPTGRKLKRRPVRQRATTEPTEPSLSPYQAAQLRGKARTQAQKEVLDAKGFNGKLTPEDMPLIDKRSDELYAKMTGGQGGTPNAASFEEGEEKIISGARYKKINGKLHKWEE
jgi:hypothetical protein